MKRFLSAFYRSMPAPLLRVGLFVISPKFNHGAVGVFQDDAGRVLLLRHVYRKTYPWGLPSGFVNPGETAEQGVLRELREETGLKGSVVRVGSTTLVAARHLETIVYGRADSTAPLRLCHEIFEGRWVEPRTLPEDVVQGLPSDQYNLLQTLKQFGRDSDSDGSSHA